MFFPQSDPEERLSQCSASLQALLALSPTALHALSKLVNSAEISDDIIGVIRNVIAKYPPKGSPEQETSIEVPLSVRLWRISGCHELLASLGFDLMEVGQDQVTLRTGKQANRRNCQFVLQALLALFDTQEAPKSLGIDSSSSCESLNDDARSEKPLKASSPVPGITDNQQRSISPVGTVKSLNMKMGRPPLPMMRGSLLSGGGAFISYVRRRGEPDGGRTDAEPTPSTSGAENNVINTTDSELSDGYTSQTLSKFDIESKPKMSYSTLRTPIKVGRPGGGGESDAAFTPSPPVTIQTIDNNVSLALAHQTRIRNLYSTSNAPGDGGVADTQISNSRRPDSSSSASSTTDWESSGHATVLRRGNQSAHMMPPMPPPRQIPLVDSLRPMGPLPPVYNNLHANITMGSVNNIESTSSDSEFERGLDMRVRTKHTSLQQQFLSRKIADPMAFIDRLSVRSEISGVTPSAPPVPALRKAITLPDDDETSLTFNANNLYFSPNDTDVGQLLETKSKDLTKTNSKDHKIGGTGNKSIQDSILRQINREMTPTISEVYHERNLGLGLAPPLSKLLLSKNYDESDAKTTNSKTAMSEVASELDLSISTVSSPSTSGSTNTERCALCSNSSDMTCSCKNTSNIIKMSLTKPWLSNVEPSIIKPSELTTADIMERQSKIKINTITNVPTLKRASSPYSELSRRDEGDGRSVADSQCSGSYKADVVAATKVVDIQERINKFNLGSKT